MQEMEKKKKKCEEWEQQKGNRLIEKSQIL